MSKKYDRIKSVAVYCGSRTPMDCAYEEAAAGLAKFIAAHGMTLVFGGSNVGTMKTVADACRAVRPACRLVASCDQRRSEKGRLEDPLAREMGAVAFADWLEQYALKPSEDLDTLLKEIP